ATPGDFVPTGAYEDRVGAAWAERPGGYSVEARVPLELVGGRLGIAVIDVDRGGADGYEVRLTGTWQPGTTAPGAFVYRTPQLAALAARFTQPGRRLRIVDAAGWVLYDAGELAEPSVFAGETPDAGPLERLLRRLLRRADPPYLD